MASAAFSADDRIDLISLEWLGVAVRSKHRQRESQVDDVARLDDRQVQLYGSREGPFVSEARG